MPQGLKAPSPLCSKKFSRIVEKCMINRTRSRGGWLARPGRRQPNFAHFSSLKFLGKMANFLIFSKINKKNGKNQEKNV